MPQPPAPPAQIVADTILRTVELGVRITDAATAVETTVLWCDLLRVSEAAITVSSRARFPCTSARRAVGLEPSVPVG
jgi:hypothetical protein